MYTKDEIDEVKATALLSELTRAAKGKGKDVYLCPACGRARVVKPTPTGIWYCQYCKEKGDVFTAVRFRDGVTHEQAFADMMNKYGHGQTVNTSPRSRPAASTPDEQPASGSLDVWRSECRQYLAACRAALPGSDGEAYMQGRGFTLDTLERFGVGFDPHAKIHGALKYGRAAVVYPYSRRLDYYAARFVKPITSASGDVAKAMKPPVTRAGSEPLFNGAALYSCEAVFVCEGAFDAMAIMQGVHALNMDTVGAVALGGTGGGRLLDMLKAKSTRARLLICLDNDDAGRAGAVALAAKLDDLGAAYAVIDGEAAFAGRKDAGEFLQADAEIMGDAVDFMLNEPAALMD